VTAVTLNKITTTDNFGSTLVSTNYNNLLKTKYSAKLFGEIPCTKVSFFLEHCQVACSKDLNAKFFTTCAQIKNYSSPLTRGLSKKFSITALSSLRTKKLTSRHAERKQQSSKSVLRQLYVFFNSLNAADSIYSLAKFQKKFITKRKLFSSRYKLLRKKMYNASYTHVYAYSRVRVLSSLFAATYLTSSARLFKKNKILFKPIFNLYRHFSLRTPLQLISVAVSEHVFKNNINALSYNVVPVKRQPILTYNALLGLKYNSVCSVNTFTSFLKYLCLNPTVLFKGRFFGNLYFSATMLSLYFQLLLNNLVCVAYKYYRFSFIANKEPYSFRFINRKKFFYLDRIDFYDLYRIILIIFKSTDIDLLKVWVKKAFEKVSFKKHKLLCYMLRFYLKRLFLVYRRYTPCLGFYLRVKGKIAVGGNARKRNFIVKQGARSLTSKNLKINYVDFSLLTGTGVLGVKLLFSFR
jgi:hypothetical protein